jgi:hypothetical protein
LIVGSRRWLDEARVLSSLGLNLGSEGGERKASAVCGGRGHKFLECRALRYNFQTCYNGPLKLSWPGNSHFRNWLTVVIRYAAGRFTVAQIRRLNFGSRFARVPRLKVHGPV